MQYAGCVNAGGCQAPADFSSEGIADYYGNSQYDNYPVIYVTWEDAG